MLTTVLASLWVFLFAQQQPIDFSHAVHTAQGVECIDCHSTVDTRASATLPSVRKCMLCHEKIATEGPGVAVLRDYAERGREAPWVRIYQFAESAHVKFRHAPHVRAKVSCQTCHGDVAAMSTAAKAVEHNMGTCVSCHRQNKASDDCAVCHY